MLLQFSVLAHPEHRHQELPIRPFLHCGFRILLLVFEPTSGAFSIHAGQEGKTFIHLLAGFISLEYLLGRAVHAGMTKFCVHAFVMYVRVIGRVRKQIKNSCMLT